MKMASIKCIGQFTIDDIVLPDGTVHMGTIGGNALYAAAGANLWCTPEKVGAVARIGRNYPSEVVDRLNICGICVDCLQSIERAHLRAWILYEENGERRSLCRNHEVLAYPPISVESFERYYAAYRSLHLEISPDLREFPVQRLVADAYHLAPQMYERHIENLRLIRRINPDAVVSLDPSPFYMRQGNDAELRSILELTDLFLPSREELFSCFGDLPIEEAAERLVDMGAKIIVIKLGKDGCLVFSRDSRTGKRYPAHETALVDSTGAGDSFCGGFLAGYLQTNSLDEAAYRGTISASLAIASYGPENLLSASPGSVRDVLTQLRKNGRGTCPNNEARNTAYE